MPGEKCFIKLLLFGIWQIFVGYDHLLSSLISVIIIHCEIVTASSLLPQE